MEDGPLSAESDTTILPGRRLDRVLVNEFMLGTKTPRKLVLGPAEAELSRSSSSESAISMALASLDDRIALAVFLRPLPLIGSGVANLEAGKG
jgi:hypothetical protein